jgi:hypothetical protein
MEGKGATVICTISLLSICWLAINTGAQGDSAGFDRSLDTDDLDDYYRE